MSAEEQQTAADQTPQSGKKRAWTKPVIFIGVLIVAVIVLRQFFSLETILGACDNCVEQVHDLGWIGPIIFGALYIPASVFFLPGSILTLAGGFLFGVPVGVITVSIGSTVGATAACLVGRYVARGWVSRKIEGSERFSAIDDAVAEEGWKIVGLTRLSPVFPFSLLNYAYGLTKISIPQYIIASWLGMLPGTLMYVYVGSLAGSLAQLGAGAESEQGKSPLEWALYVVGLLATVAVTVYITRIAKKALKKRVTA